MSTNYYAALDVCEHCRRGEKSIHLGKAAGGCRFSFAYNGGGYYKNFEELKALLSLPTTQIKDEYDRYLTYDEFIEMIKYLQTHTRAVKHEEDIIDGEYRFHIYKFS